MILKRSTPEENRYRRCPVNGNEYPLVGTATIKQHLLRPWKRNLENHHYYCCDDPDCRVKYFNERDETITIDQLRELPGLKTKNPNDTLCFCFGVSNADTVGYEAKAYVVTQTKSHACACKTRNPFGRCCLKDFPN